MYLFEKFKKNKNILITNNKYKMNVVCVIFKILNKLYKQYVGLLNYCSYSLT